MDRKRNGNRCRIAMMGRILTLFLFGLICMAPANSQNGVPLLDKAVSNVNATSNVTVNPTLDHGFILSGIVSSADPNSQLVSVTAQSTTSSSLSFSSGFELNATNTYKIVLPADTYNISASFDNTVGTEVTSFSFTATTSLTISSDTKYNFSLPAVNIMSVTGTVSNLNTNFTAQTVTFFSKTIPGFTLVAADATLGSMGTYSVNLPSGSFDATLTQSNTSITTFTSSSATSDLGFVTVSNPLNLTAPTLNIATLSGTGSFAGTAMVPAGTSLFVSDVTGGTAPSTVSSGDQVLFSGPFGAFDLTTGRTYAVSPSVPFQILPSPAPPAIYNPPDPSPAQLTANSVRTITWSAIPGPSTPETISGKVTITNTSTPVPRADVEAFSNSLTNAPNSSFSNGTTTDALGNFSLTVPSGTYELVVTGEPPTPGDFFGNGDADVAVFRPSNGTWYVINPDPSVLAVQWGVSGDIPVRGDYDGDGITDIAVFRPSSGTWYIIPSSAPTTFTATQWGVTGDIPVPGDYDGDGKTDIAVWRPSTGTWYILPSSMPGTFIAVNWGLSGDIPVPGDYDGDGKTDMAVWRPSTGTWYVIPSSAPTTFTATQWGVSSDIPVPGDYDGDGKTDMAVWRPSTGTWYVIPSSAPTTFTATQWGVNGDMPVPVDYDRDRKTDKAVWRPSNGTWYIIPSSAPNTFTSTQWGISTDVPVQKPIGQ